MQFNSSFAKFLVGVEIPLPEELQLHESCSGRSTMHANLSVETDVETGPFAVQKVRQVFFF